MIHRMLTVLLAGAIACIAAAQSPSHISTVNSTTSAQSPKPPVISDRQKLEYLKAQLALGEILPEFNKRKAAADASAKAIADQCGAEYDARIDDATHEPVCAEKPKPPQPAAPKK